MILATVNQSLQVTLSGAPSTPWPVVVDVQDLYRVPTGAVTTFSLLSTLAGVGPTTIAGPPGSTVLTRTIVDLTITNAGATTLTLTLQINNNGSLLTVYLVAMDPGDVLTYSVAAGFVVVNRNGQVKTAAAITSSSTSPVSVQLSDGTQGYDLLSLPGLLRDLTRQNDVQTSLLMNQGGGFVPIDERLPF